MTSTSSRLILASSSPYRKALLQRLQVPFDVVKPNVDESIHPGETASPLVRRLSEEKARAALGKLNDVIVIGSDQVVAVDNTILGKPGDHNSAEAQLKQISGKRVVFHTGLTVIESQTAKIQTDEIKTYVEFKQLTEEMIQAYLKKEPAYNCAGAFKSEGLGIVLTERIIEDDPTALIGLPLIRLTQMLEKINYPLLK